MGISRNFILFLCSLFVSIGVFANPQKITFQSKIYNPDGTPLEAAAVQFKFSLMDPLSTCVIFSETFTNVDLSSSEGSIVLNLGDGTRDYPVAGGMVWQDGFNNLTSSYNCQAGGTYSPVSTESRKVVMQFNDGGPNGWQTLPAMEINTVPYAMFAYSSDRLGGRPVTDFVLASALPGGGTTAASAVSPGYLTSSDWTRFNSAMVNSADITAALGYTPGSTSLASVNGTAPISVVNTTTTPVISISQANGTTNGYLTSADWTTFNNKLSAITSSDVSTAYGYVPGNTSLTSVNGTGPISVVNTTTTPSISIARADGSTSGYLSSSDWTTFNNKLSAITSSDISTALTYQPASSSDVSANYLKLSGGTVTGNLSVAQSLDATKVLYGSGTFAEPSLAFSVDKNTGFFSPFAVDNNQLGVTAGGLHIFTFTQAGMASQSAWGPNLNYTNGTPALPAYGFVAEAGIGIYRTTTQTMAFSTSSTERMRINASGDVGIGVTNPSYALQVSGDISVSGNFKVNGVNINSGTVTSVSGTLPISVASGTTTPVISMARSTAAVDGYLSSGDWTTFNNKLSAITSSDVTTALTYTPISGSGTNNTIPKFTAARTLANSILSDDGSTLTVSGGTYIGGALDTASNITSSTAQATAYASSSGVVNVPSGGLSWSISNTSVNDGTFSVLKMSAKNASNIVQRSYIGNVSTTGAGSYTPAIVFGLQTGLASYDETMRINSTGYVGIGTTSPDDLLHLRKIAVAAESYPLRLQNRDNTVGAATGLLFKAHTTNADDSYKGGILFERTTGSGRGKIHFLQNNVADTSNVTLANSVMTISNNGNVGIGTTSPGYALEVSGDVSVSGAFKVNGVDISTGSGTVTSVTGTSPVTVATGTTTPVISMAKATAAVNGYLSSSDWTTFNNKLSNFSAMISSDVTTALGFSPISNVSGDMTGALSLNTAGGITVARLEESASDGYLKLYTGDTIERVRISSYGDSWLASNNNGKVGIGTAAPGNKLEVVNAIDNIWALSVSSPATIGQSWGAIVRAGTNSSDISFAVNNPDSSLNYFRVRGDGAVSIPNGALTVGGAGNSSFVGNLGIGISTPDSLLDVRGQALVSGTSGAGYRAVFMQGSNSDVSIIGSTSGGGRTRGDFAVWTNDTERMRFTASGDVGIGTTSPLAKFQVTASGDAEYVYAKDTGGNLIARIGSTGGAANGGYFELSSSNTAAIALRAYPGQNSYINNAGNFGIGTATPAASLDVSGNVKVGSYMKMSSAGATIYVSTTGNDTTGTGLVGAPYLTVTRALQDVPTVLDHAYIIQLVNGSYASETVNVKGFSGRGILTIRGNEGDANVDTLSVSMAATSINVLNVGVPVHIRNIAFTGDSSIATQKSSEVSIYRINVNRNTGAGTWAQILRFYQTKYAYVDSAKLVTTGEYGGVITSSGSYVVSSGNTVTGAGNGSTEAGIESSNAGYIYTVGDTVSGFTHGITTGETHYGNATGGDIVLQLTNVSSSGVCIYNGNGGRITEFQAGSYVGCTVYSSTNFGIGSKNPAQKLQVGENGDGTVAIANAWNTFSDIRLKNIISKIPDADEIIDKLNGYYYTWKNGTDKSRQVGVIAQEIEAVLPELVKTGSDGIKTVDYPKLTAVLIESTKKHKREISSLKAENVELKEILSKICKNRPDLCK